MWELLALIGFVVIAGGLFVFAARWADRDPPPRSRDDWWNDDGEGS